MLTDVLLNKIVEYSPPDMCLLDKHLRTLPFYNSHLPRWQHWYQAYKEIGHAGIENDKGDKLTEDTAYQLLKNTVVYSIYVHFSQNCIQDLGRNLKKILATIMGQQVDNLIPSINDKVLFLSHYDCNFLPLLHNSILKDNSYRLAPI